MAEWMPIESAPRDKSWFLAWRSHGVKPLIVRLDDEYGAHEQENGDFVYHLTHWMPLPEPPEVKP